MSDYDASAALREIAMMAPRKNGPKLAFSTLCAAYAALIEGISPALIARTFGLSRTSVSNLGGCRNDTRPPVTMELQDYNSEGYKIIRTYEIGHLNITKSRRPNRKPRYQDVARQYDALGEEKFKQAYFTPEWRTRLKAAAQTTLTGDPAAALYDWKTYGIITDAWGETFCAEFRHDGWRFIVARDGKPAEDSFPWRGDDDDKPFITSDALHKFIQKPR